MTLQQIKYILTISQTGSMNKAAEILYVSQPSLTAAVHELGRELGITIFLRSGRGVHLTQDGSEFLTYARQLYHQYDAIVEKYGPAGKRKKKFGVSAQHYSFAVKAFVETVKACNADEYEFAVREEQTMQVIRDVQTLRSEIGILYLSDFNRNFLQKIFRANDLEFHKLIDCSVYAYLCKWHPLAGREYVTVHDLADYPCFTFEQGDDSSFYFSEEIFSMNEYAQTIKVNDRATMLNLMVGLNGYTLCSGIICQELNGSDYAAIPLRGEGAVSMEIGYITRRDQLQSTIGGLYIENIRRYLTDCIY